MKNWQNWWLWDGLDWLIKVLSILLPPIGLYYAVISAVHEDFGWFLIFFIVFYLGVFLGFDTVLGAVLKDVKKELREELGKEN